MPSQRESQSGRLIIKSGPPTPELPHRYGCACGAVWNTSRPLTIPGTGKQLCGPYCIPRLSPLDKREGSASWVLDQDEVDVIPRRLKRVSLLDGETLYEMWAEAIPCPKGWDELHVLEQAPWTALAGKLVDMDGPGETP